MKKLLVLLFAIFLALPAIAQDAVVANEATDILANVIQEASESGWLMIKAEDALNQMDTIEPMIIDVRTQKEIDEEGKIAGSIHIVVTELENNLFQLPPDKSTPIIMYCALGTRGLYGTIFLKSLGFENVRDLKGGFKGWVKEGYPIVK